MLFWINVGLIVAMILFFVFMNFMLWRQMSQCERRALARKKAKEDGI